MQLQDKIRTLREQRQWTQDDMADKLGMSKNGYGKIERGESRVSLDKLEKLAQIFDVDIIELINHYDKGIVCLIGENHGQNANYYGISEKLQHENEKLVLELRLKDELLKQQAREIEHLQNMIELLQQKIARQSNL